MCVCVCARVYAQNGIYQGMHITDTNDGKTQQNVTQSPNINCKQLQNAKCEPLCVKGMQKNCQALLEESSQAPAMEQNARQTWARSVCTSGWQMDVYGFSGMKWRLKCCFLITSFVHLCMATVNCDCKLPPHFLDISWSDAFSSWPSHCADIWHQTSEAEAAHVKQSKLTSHETTTQSHTADTQQAYVKWADWSSLKQFEAALQYSMVKVATAHATAVSRIVLCFRLQAEPWSKMPFVAA